MWTLLAIISLVILGGFLSYYGDLQGRRWGKKRVSLFGLRPKHTAILITSITGSVISLLSVITVLVAFPPIRDVILRGERAIRDNRKLLAQLEEQKKFSDNQLKDQKMATALIQAQKDTAQSDLRQNRDELTRSLSELTQRQRELSTLTQNNVILQTEIGKRRDEIRRQQVTEKKLAATTRQLRNETHTLTALNASSAQLNDDLSRQNIGKIRENLALAKQNKELDADYHALIAKQEDLAKKNDILSNSNNFLLAQSADTLKANEEKKRQLQSEIQTLQGRIAVINRQMEDLQIGAQDALRLAGTLRSTRIATRYGEVLARRTLDPHSRPEAVANELHALIEDASALSLLHGGSRGSNGRAVFTVGENRTLLTGTQQDAEDAILRSLVKQFTAASTPTLLTAYTIANSVQGEQLPIQIIGTPIRPTFRKGEMIAFTDLDGSGSIVQVVDEIIRFLQKQVREAALNAGIQPQLDSQTGTQEVGTLTPAELVTLTDRIRKTGGQVRVTAFAATSQTTADPLRLAFKVERAKSQTLKRVTDASSRD